MPRYPCTRCGETVDTGPSFAPPLNILCPDCRGAAAPPQEARPATTPPPPPLPSHASFAIPLHPQERRGIPWWAGVVISHLLAVPILCVFGIAENERDPVLEGTMGGVFLGIVMLMILDAISLGVGLIGAGILRLFKFPFGRSLALVSSIFLSLTVLLVLLGFLLPEEVVEGDSALPKVEG